MCEYEKSTTSSKSLSCQLFQSNSYFIKCDGCIVEQSWYHLHWRSCTVPWRATGFDQEKLCVILHTVPSDGVIERCGTVHEKKEFIIDFRYLRFILAYDMGQYIKYEQMSRQSRSIYDAATKLIRDNDNWLLLLYCAQESISNVCQTFQSFRIFTMRIIDKKDWRLISSI